MSGKGEDYRKEKLWKGRRESLWEIARIAGVVASVDAISCLFGFKHGIVLGALVVLGSLCLRGLLR